MRRHSGPLLIVAFASLVAACSSSDDSGVGRQHVSDGGPSSGGASSGGTANGGAANGGAANGGATNGGAATGGITNGGAGGAMNPCKPGPLSTPTGRPSSSACPPTSTAVLPEAGTCTAAAGCPLGLKCVNGKCALDACLVDSDCASGSACVCATSFYGGNGVHGNVCVTAQCRVDADCGSSNACSPSFSGYCGAPAGYYCHSSADTCQTDTDCCLDTPACRYQPTVGHWGCQSVTVCAG